jgi:hypothetical protein
MVATPVSQGGENGSIRLVDTNDQVGAVDYRKVIVTREHGEIGPMVAERLRELAYELEGGAALGAHLRVGPRAARDASPRNAATALR